MYVNKVCAAREPTYHFGTLNPGRFLRQDCVERRPGSVSKIINYPVQLWIAVDIGYQRDEIAITIAYFTLERFLKQAACAILLLIVSHGVGNEEILEGTALVYKVVISEG